MSMTLKEITQRFKEANDDPMKLMDCQDEIIEFAQELDSIGTDILNSKGDDYSMDMFNMISALAMTILVSRGDVHVVALIDILIVQKYAALVMKLSIGMGVTEELR